MHKIPLILFICLTGLWIKAQTRIPIDTSMNTKTIYAFAEAINAHDIGAIYALMTDDHTFIDAHGNQVTGRDKMKAGWAT